MDQLALLILIVHVLAAVCIIALVLVQQGKGATTGAAFGSGASQTVFGSRGSGSFLLKITIGFAVLFFATSIVLNNLATKSAHRVNEIVLPANLPAEPAKTSADPAANIPEQLPGVDQMILPSDQSATPAAPAINVPDQLPGSAN
jgi:preprotein translocase subunit SecG